MPGTSNVTGCFLLMGSFVFNKLRTLTLLSYILQTKYLNYPHVGVAVGGSLRSISTDTSYSLQRII